MFHVEQIDSSLLASILFSVSGRVAARRGGAQTALGRFRRFQLRTHVARAITTSPARDTSTLQAASPTRLTTEASSMPSCFRAAGSRLTRRRVRQQVIL
jgi:hypothetical protein